MSMMSEIESLMTEVGASSSYRIVNVGGKSLYVEGIKNLVDLKSEQIQFGLKNHLLTIVGNNLKIKYLDKTTAVIDGEIKEVITK
ncbi:MAG: hypothetical protein E7374_03240 [Clostridiales bacterium]|nr:hypothetical protein [Clostridiales bacterium]